MPKNTGSGAHVPSPEGVVARARIAVQDRRAPGGPARSEAGNHLANADRGTLYVVATPIGNLGDLSARARATLAQVSLVAAEDTRHTAQLLRSLGLDTRLTSLHEHNEQGRVAALLAVLDAGDSVALVSDAGTPLVADPGYALVAAAQSAGHRVVPIPGPCAAVAALSVAGLPTDRFCFEGFLPAKSVARRARLQLLAGEERTLVFYEAPHRVRESLADLAQVMGARRATIGRELTKLHETLYHGTLVDLAESAGADPDIERGELVLVVAGAVAAAPEEHPGMARLLAALLAELPVSRAVDVAVAATGARRNVVYKAALAMRDDSAPGRGRESDAT